MALRATDEFIKKIYNAPTDVRLRYFERALNRPKTDGLFYYYCDVYHRVTMMFIDNT